MAEFAIAVTVLVLLLLGMPVIARYHELQFATLEGARQLAFRDSWNLVGPPDANLGALRAALFPAAADAGQPEAGNMEARFDVGAAPGLAGHAASTWLAPFRLAAGSSFDLRDNAFHGADLKVAVTDPPGLPEPFAGLALDLLGHYRLLGDGWASGGPDQVAHRSAGLLVARTAWVLRPLLSVGRELISLVEPAFQQFCPGMVDPEQVPADRLGGKDVDGPRSAWRPAC
jgi:hypothetical protein